MKIQTLSGLFTGTALLITLVLGQTVFAQHEHTEPQCDVEAVIDHQAEHAEELTNFADEAQTDLDTALANLYRTAIAYQALAAECGFDDAATVEAAHDAEHGIVDGHDEELDVMEVARSIGDPELGKLLFNAFRSEVSFACATCHRVDSTDVLIGPGLLGVAGTTHDHNAHNAAEPTADSHDDHTEATEATAEPTPAVERTIEEAVAYLRTSIVDPSAFVAQGSVDNLMPKTYSEFLSEQEVNDLVAYLFTLQ